MFDRTKRFIKNLGPGLVTGASDDDPSGIATYTQAGAHFGYVSLWTSLFTLPLLISIQEMCARIAVVTKKGLIANLRERFSMRVVWIVIALVACANIINIGADLGMMAASAKLVFDLPFWAWLGIMTVGTLALQIFLSYTVYAKYLKWLALSLVAYVIVACIVRVDWHTAFRGTFVPVFPWTKDFILLFVALLGTTISPYVHLWQTNQGVEEVKKVGMLEKIAHQLRNRDADVFSGMGYSNIASWFIILTAAAVLHTHGFTNISTAAEAAAVLEPLAGRFSSIVFSLGVLGTGLMTIPILSSVVAYAVCEAVGCRGGLSRKWYEAKRFYGIVIVVTLLGVLINVSRVGPIKLLIFAAICNAIADPPLLFMIMRLGGDRVLMKRYANGRLSKIFGWATFGVMSVASITAIVFLFL
jgi:NRAMP (natural resistance-associated macrophage protein)-like metal ion transporter